MELKLCRCFVARSSNAVLRDNTLSSNGQRRFDDPNVFFDSGLSVQHASTVRSEGNTYKDNQYVAVSVGLQSSFRNGSFLPREPGHPPIAGEKDTIIQKGSDPTNSGSCKTGGSPFAVDLLVNRCRGNKRRKSCDRKPDVTCTTCHCQHSLFR